MNPRHFYRASAPASPWNLPRVWQGQLVLPVPLSGLPEEKVQTQFLLDNPPLQEARDHA